MLEGYRDGKPKPAEPQHLVFPWVAHPLPRTWSGWEGTLVHKSTGGNTAGLRHYIAIQEYSPRVAHLTTFQEKLKMTLFMWNLSLRNVGNDQSLHRPLRLGLPICKAWVYKTELFLNACSHIILPVILGGGGQRKTLRLRVEKWLAYSHPAGRGMCVWRRWRQSWPPGLSCHTAPLPGGN